MRTAGLFVVGFAFVAGASIHAAEPGADALVQKVVRTAGGEGKILKLFRIKEMLNVSSDPEKAANARVSVLEPPNYWWLGKKERVKDDKEPATFLVWAWTLGAITDPKSKVEAIPEIMEDDKPAFGLRISETINPPMDMTKARISSSALIGGPTFIGSANGKSRTG